VIEFSAMHMRIANDTYHLCTYVRRPSLRLQHYVLALQCRDKTNIYNVKRLGNIKTTALNYHCQCVIFAPILHSTYILREWNKNFILIAIYCTIHLWVISWATRHCI